MTPDRTCLTEDTFCTQLRRATGLRLSSSKAPTANLNRAADLAQDTSATDSSTAPANTSQHAEQDSGAKYSTTATEGPDRRSRATEAQLDARTTISAMAWRDRKDNWHLAIIDITVQPLWAPSPYILDLPPWLPTQHSLLRTPSPHHRTHNGEERERRERKERREREKEGRMHPSWNHADIKTDTHSGT